MYFFYFSILYVELLKELGTFRLSLPTNFESFGGNQRRKYLINVFFFPSMNQKAIIYPRSHLPLRNYLIIKTFPDFHLWLIPPESSSNNFWWSILFWCCAQDWSMLSLNHPVRPWATQKPRQKGTKNVLSWQPILSGFFPTERGNRLKAAGPGATKYKPKHTENMHGHSNSRRPATHNLLMLFL